MAEHDIELPACFYLGREYDLHEKKILPDAAPIMYDARDLLTHGVVVGMTGSGKTGLCISILEEAAIDGIPCIILDIKGDLCNLLLQFTDLNPEDFQRWVNPEDARLKGMTIDEYSQQLADRWKKGLEDTLQSPDRIRRLRDSSEWKVYTPGSDAGLPLSILRNFAAPVGKVTREALTQKIDATTSALLGLTGIVSDPVQSREHILIAQILLHAWNKGENLDLAQLITRVQLPPLRTIGAFDIETFYPEKERLKLAVALNNILASPSFSTWIEGDALDIGQLLSGEGKPKHLIFYLAHLDDSQRMFFLALLLDEVLTWTRKQPGTSSLKALLYFDEVFGYLPPHPGNPPTKQPLMTLLKQARAFGVGILLATQNPVDLDYKALSNAGTWLVGKLQTERDKARLMQGLEGVAAERGTLADRKYLETVIASLGNRVFLLHDVHRPKPVVFQCRWALSFLRGPMTREQIELLMSEEKERRSAKQEHTDVEARQEDQTFKEQLRRGAAELTGQITHVAPVLPTGLVPYYIPLRSIAKEPTKSTLPVAQRLPDDHPVADAPIRRTIVYQARLLGFAEVTFIDKKRNLDIRRPYRFLADQPTTGQPTSWIGAESIPETISDIPIPNAEWMGVPDGWNTPKKIASLKKEFNEHLYRYAKLTLFENSELELLSSVGEDVQSFLERCKQLAPQAAEKEIAEAKLPFQKKFEELTAKIPADIPPPLPTPTAKSFWDLPVLSWFKPGPDVIHIPPAKVVDPKVAKAKDELAKHQEAWQQKRAEIYAKWTKLGQEYAEVLLKPRKVDVSISHFGLAWVPFWRCDFADGRMEMLPAYERCKVE